MANNDTSPPSPGQTIFEPDERPAETTHHAATTTDATTTEPPVAQEQARGAAGHANGEARRISTQGPTTNQQNPNVAPSPSISLPDGQMDDASGPTAASTPSDARRPVLSRASSQAQTVYSERPRTDSQSTSRTTAALRPTDSGSIGIAIKSLETIAATKEGRKKGPLGEALNKSLTALKNANSLAETDPIIVFEALELATQSSTHQVVTAALDCIGKLMNYSYFQHDDDSVPNDKEQVPLIELVIDAIWKSAGESALPEVQVNIVRALLAAVLNDRIVVHGAGLLKCVRHTYGLTLTARTATTQQVAQSVLMQMIGTIFERAKTRLTACAHRVASTKSSVSHANDDTGSEYATANENSETPTEAANSPVHPEHGRRASTQMTLQTFERRASSDENQIQVNELSAPTIISPMRGLPTPSRTPSGQTTAPAITVQTEFSQEELEDEATIKDAYLIFRAMCKLGDKPMAYDDPLALRTKMLNLSIVKNVLEQHHQVFTSPFSVIKTSTNSASVSFTQAVKPYLCLSLSRNGASSVEPLFAISCDVFWLMAKHLRVFLKKELEVFMKEIYFATLDKRSAPPFQKQHITDLFMKMASDGKFLVEMYLNYDCDRTVADNMFQRVIEHVSRQACAPVSVTSEQETAYYDKAGKGRVTDPHGQARSTHGTTIPPEYTTKQQSLECLVASLQSMYTWARQVIAETSAPNEINTARSSLEERQNVAEQQANDNNPSSIDPVAAEEIIAKEDTAGGNDYAELERVKQSKTALNEAIRQFNFKPKKGLSALLQHGFIADDSPETIAAFFLSNDRIDKASLGEFLGEANDTNVAVMHAFVDQLDFTKTRFVEALRKFLQSFRLPGEAQKIDRLMLKFAERYTNGNPQAFANADTAYVLSYSVIMLNTDQHSSNVKKKMTVEDFIKNNRGINDQENLPDEYLNGIFEEIASNEIVLDTERERAANLGQLQQPAGGLAANIGQALATVGRDLQREAYAQASEAMSNKTEQMFKSLLKSQRRGQQKGSEGRYLEAQSHLHVGPMFEATYISYLTALSGHAQETSNLDAIHLCIEGQKLAMRIACLFDLEHPRRAFAGAFARATSLYNLGDMKPRHVEALKALIEIANTEGDLLKESWRDILTTISQLDRFQLISTGVREGDIPDVLKGQQKTKAQPTARRRQRSEVSLDSAVAEELGSAEMIRSVDRIFTNTPNIVRQPDRIFCPLA